MGAPNHQVQGEAGDSARSRIGRVQLRVHHAGQVLPPPIPDAEDLITQLRNVLAGMGQADDGSYWVIKRLNIQFRVNPSAPFGGISQGFAQALKDVLTRVLAGQIVQGVRRFDSRAHWLAECLWAASAGDLAHSWHFARYHWLAPLPVGDQIRLAVTGEPAAALFALRILSCDGRLPEVLRRAGETGARGTLKAMLVWSPAGADVPVPAGFAADVAALRRATGLGRYAAALCALVDGRAYADASGLPRWRALERALSPALATVVPAAETTLGQELTGPMARQAVTRQPAEDARDPVSFDLSQPVSARLAAAEIPELLETRFAGVFVIWRSVVEMQLLSLLPDEPGHRLALAAAIAGPAHAAAAQDPAIHWLTGFDPDAHSIADPPADLAPRFFAHYVDWRFPRNLAPCARRVGHSLLLQDSETEDWLGYGSARALRPLRDALGPMQVPAIASRNPLIDADWFGVTYRTARRPWVILARAAFADFARRLHGLDRASAKWCWDKLLAGRGELALGNDPVITLPRVELDIVLRMGALDGCRVPTAHGAITLRLPGGRDAT